MTEATDAAPQPHIIDVRLVRRPDGKWNVLVEGRRLPLPAPCPCGAFGGLVHAIRMVANLGDVGEAEALVLLHTFEATANARDIEALLDPERMA